MLILTRRPGERIKIGHDVEITVLDIGSGQVKLGIAAPREIGVYRTEILEEVQSESIEAVEQSGNVNLMHDQLKKLLKNGIEEKK